jgi:hypothetical protein
VLHRLRFGRRIFRETFETPSGRMVLAHLRRFCGEECQQSAFDADPLGIARNVGRQEVYREIRRFLDLTDDQIDLAGRAAVERGELGP